MLFKYLILTCRRYIIQIFHIKSIKPLNNNTLNKTHIFHIIPSFSHGGMPIGIACIMNHYSAKVRHSLFSTNGGYGCSARIKDNVEFTITDIENAAQGNIIQRVRRYIKILKEIKPDVLLTYNWGSTEWALAASFIPELTHYHLEHGFGPDESDKTLLKRDLFRRLALRNMNGLIVPSQNLVNIARTAWKISDEKIHYIANGVDCDRFASKPQKTAIPNFTPTEGEVIIGTLTPLRPEKNLTRLIEAFDAVRQKLPKTKIRLLIMGEGNEREKLEALITDRNLTQYVVLAGHIEAPEYALGLLDIYCMSSDTEQMPIAIQEAMAAGLPIVGIDVGDVKNVMHQDNKEYITPLGDEKAYIDAIASLCQDKAKRSHLAEINKQHVREYYDEQVMFKNYAPFWHSSYEPPK
jgi:glycosyltransferase involved in cell wall biosynthesis